MSDERQRFVDTLNAAHEFPVRYTFKLIGDNNPALVDEALKVLKTIIPHAQPEITRRESDKGKHQSITMVVEVPSAETVHDIYEQFRGLPGMRMLL